MKPAALLPQFNERKERLETSIFRTHGLSSRRCWHLGYVHAENSRRIKARGVEIVSIILGEGLAIEVDGDPFPRHADITGWDDAKPLRLLKATQIADKLRLEIDPREPQQRVP